MNKKSILLFLTPIFISACNNTTKSQQVVKSDSTISELKSDSSTIVSKGNHGDIFVFENDTLIQRLNITFLSDARIKFKIEVSNKHSGNKSSFEGLAKRQTANDPEIDEDKDGNAYAATTYLYSDNCWLSFRIDEESKAFARIVEADCNNKHKPDCPFESLGTLVRVSVKQ